MSGKELKLEDDDKFFVARLEIIRKSIEISDYTGLNREINLLQYNNTQSSGSKIVELLKSKKIQSLLKRNRFSFS